MLGTDKEPGIYVRTLNDLFRAIEETSDDMLYSVSMSYLEVSLLHPLTPPPLDPQPLACVKHPSHGGKGHLKVIRASENGAFSPLLICFYPKSVVFLFKIAH